MEGLKSGGALSDQSAPPEFHRLEEIEKRCCAPHSTGVRSDATSVIGELGFDFSVSVPQSGVD